MNRESSNSRARAAGGRHKRTGNSTATTENMRQSANAREAKRSNKLVELSQIEDVVHGPSQDVATERRCSTHSRC